MKPIIESCCRLEKRLRNLLATINESEIVNDIVCLNDNTEVYSIVYIVYITYSALILQFSLYSFILCDYYSLIRFIRANSVK